MYKLLENIPWDKLSEPSIVVFFVLIIIVILYKIYSKVKLSKIDLEKTKVIVGSNDKFVENVKISIEAGELLDAASKDEFGTIFIYSGLSETTIQSNKIHFAKENSPRIIAKYKGALNELVKNNFIDKVNEVKYMIKESGYKYIKERDN